MQRKPMTRPRKQQFTPAPVPRRTTRASPAAPTSGYTLVVDGQMKTEFKTHDAARQSAESLKRRHPALQVRIFDAETKSLEQIELAGP